MIIPFSGQIYTVLNMEDYNADIWKEVGKAFRGLSQLGGWG